MERRVVLGVCAMEKKSQSKSMAEILARIEALQEFEIVQWTDDQILNLPQEQWPACDVLISFFSSGFPLAKAQAYVRRVQPVCINDLDKQHDLLDRFRVYNVLKSCNIAVPRNVFVDRRDQSEPGPRIIENNDFISIDGFQIQKPFVEKPLSGEDHNIYIYYKGGGSRRLFRKVGNRSSQAYPTISRVRRNGSFVYEEMIGGCRDIKVYTVGPGFAHAESRKSPTIDGVVERDVFGKEKRAVFALTKQEREIASRVCTAFSQAVCGFDMLRGPDGRSYVIDVNGWSFVKGDLPYFDHCARILSSMARAAFQRPMPTAALKHLCDRVLQQSKSQSPQEQSSASDTQSSSSSQAPRPTPVPLPIIDSNTNHILLGVATVFRHADRTPKQKLKFMTTDPKMLQFFGDSTKDFKFKKPKDLKRVLDTVEARLKERYDKKQFQLTNVLENNYPGTKFQMKALEIVDGKVVAAKCICK